ncbi:MAG: hypothetical protein QNK37_38165 [Acidobacteriota bacterium]|nr:hypothetical protein [Acidobacteriota bacterium]
MPVLLLLFLVLPPEDFTLPKHPPKLKNFSRDYGPRPGSQTTKTGSSVFRRVYYRPASLRLLVRANCTATPDKDDLIQQAERRSLEDGPPVQVDWGSVRGSRASYYAVMYLKKTVSKIDLTARDGRYEITNKSSYQDGQWVVKRLNIPKAGGNCATTREITNRDMRAAVLNVLSEATLAHFRSNPG